MILTINGGSSSIKFAVFKAGNVPEKIHSGQVKAIGSPDMKFVVNDSEQNLPDGAQTFEDAITGLMGWLEKEIDFEQIIAIGHRVVHGMQHTEPSVITSELLADLKKLIPYDPDHLPDEIKLIEAFSRKHPKKQQIACFDTAFHQTMPRVAKLLPIPRRFDAQGIHRYGFHGLSYNYLINKLEEIAGKEAAHGRVILAHLGSGASLAAVYDGKSIDTSMGFTPAGGIPMSSRSGDIDPGVAWIMMKTENLSPKQFSHLVNHESGLKGVSETSADISELLKHESTDERAKEAVDLFCYQVKKWIGSFAAALGGVDTLVFAGGIGENSPVIRARICDGLQFLGIELDEKQHNDNSTLISKAGGKVAVRVIPTDEEMMMAKIISGMTADRNTK